MASKWRQAKWGDEVSLEYGKALRDYSTDNGRYQVFGSNGPIGWTAQALAPGPGVILGRKGAYRGVRYSAGPFHVIDTAYYVKPQSCLDMRWLYYAIVHHRLGEIDDGSPIPSTTRAAVYVRDVEIPPLNEQRAIAHILGTLDDKIELNRRMNETLEAMVQALFKSWFVDFDPVRAKAEGRKTGLPKQIDELFPDSFQDSSIGAIPVGWHCGAVSDVAVHPRRCVRPAEIVQGTPYIALEHMPRRCIALSEWDAGEAVESNKYRFEKGDILFGKLRPYFHKVGVAPVDGVCSTDIVVVAPREPEWFGFVLGHLSSDAFVERVDAQSSGTKMPRTKWSDMGSYPVVIPADGVAMAFTSQIRPAIDRILSSIHESRALGALRDTLLPKLISGEMRVGDALRVAVAAKGAEVPA